jgi:uncharacterized membrane protein
MAETSQEIKASENFLGALCYLFGWITGLILWFSGFKKKFIRFHAMQSIIVSVVLMIIFFVLSWVPNIGWIISGLGILAFILWVFLMVKAYQGQTFKLPIIGNLADKWSNNK